MRLQLAIICLLMIAPACAFSQKVDTAVAQLEHVLDFPNHFLAKLQGKEQKLDEALTRQTEKYLEKLARREKKMQNKLETKDSAAAQRLFTGVQEKYRELENKVEVINGDISRSLSGEYRPYVDSLKGALSFLQNNQQLLAKSPLLQSQLGPALTQFNQLQFKLQTTDEIKQFISKRRQLLKEQLQRYVDATGYKKYLDDYNKQVYYYSAQIKEYREMLNDPDKMFKKALTLLNHLPDFKQFMKNNSQLSGLFGVASDYGSPTGIDGLQTRDQVQQLIQGQVGSGGTNGVAALQSNLQSAHQQLDQFKDKLNALGGGSGDIDMPNFKRNEQKTKPFLKRLQYGSNLQTTRSSYFFPTTTDIGFSLGYKMGNKGIVGIGGSYKIGWGKDINHVQVTSEGASIRSFLDWQIKKNFYASGGFEMNYQQPFTGLQQLYNMSAWQQSGLIGATKMVSLRSKVLKQTKLQILWDFLSYYQIPRSQAFKFRVGYNF